MSCQTRPHISSDVREGSWVGGKSSPRAMMLSYANITRKRVPSISPHHNIHVRFFKDPWRLNSIHASNIIYSATILVWTCTDRAVKDAKMKKKMLLKQFVQRGKKLPAVSAEQETQGQDESAALHGVHSVGEDTERTEMCICVFSPMLLTACPNSLFIHTVWFCWSSGWDISCKFFLYPHCSISFFFAVIKCL